MKLLLLDRPVDKNILKDREVEFFGPWAQPIQSPEDLTEPAFEPYPTPESVCEASLKAISAAHSLLEQLSNVMPSLTGINRGERFWKILLSHHVLALAGIVQDTIVRHQALPEKDYVLGLADDSDYVKEQPPRSWADGVALLFIDGRFPVYLIGQYLQSYYRNREFIRYLQIPRRRLSKRSDELFALVSNNGWRNLFKRAIYRLYGHSLWRRKEAGTSDEVASLVLDQYQLDDFNFKKLGANILTEEFLPDVKSLPYFSVDEEKRKRLKDSLLPPYGELLSLSLPLVAIEGLPYLVNYISAEDGRRFRKVEHVYTHGQGFVYEAPKRVLLALLADDGKRIVSVQHGGGVAYLAHSAMFLEKMIADEYISWGGGYSNFDELPNANETKVLPSIYLTKLRQKSLVNKKRQWEILLAVAEEHRYVKWLRSPLFPDMAHGHFAREKVLFDYFGMKKQVAIKVYPEAYGWGQADWIRAKYPGVKLLVSGRFVDYALKSRIVIVDYNSSIFLEMLAMGRPFLATWSRRWFKGNALFEEFIDRLIEVEVFYEQPEELIKSYANTISADVDQWWSESKRQRVIKEMVDNFALTSDAIGEEWHREFQQV